MKKIIFLFLFCSIIAQQKTNAQSRLGIFAGYGTTWYYGDLNDRLITSKELFGHYWNAGFIYQMSKRSSLSLHYINAYIEGADSLAIHTYNKKRNLHFQSNIEDIAIRYEYQLFKNKSIRRKQIFTPYLIVGLGALHHNPTAIYNGEKVELQPLGTEGQYIEGGQYPKPYKLYQLSVPAGLGIEARLSNAFSLRFELVNHWTFFDYLDDISTVFADSTKLSQTPNGPMAVALANNFQKGYPADGVGRGNKNNNDTYMTAGFAIVYRMYHSNQSGIPAKGRKSKGKKKKKHNCAAYD
ncbi:MAG: DUF6089 family protein [Bacteroidota bacterium]